MNRFVFISLLLLSGCYPPAYRYDHQFTGKGSYISDVPFFSQEDYYCGPASMASVLNYWGSHVSQEDVAGKVFTPKLKGSVTVDMLNYAREAGFDASTYSGSIQEIRREVDNRHPLILYIDLGYSIFPSGHYIVVVGYDDIKEGVIAYSEREKDLFIPYKKLIKSWGKTGFWTLLIIPRDSKGEK